MHTGAVRLALEVEIQEIREIHLVSEIHLPKYRRLKSPKSTCKLARSAFYPRDAMLARILAGARCLSLVGVLSKRIEHIFCSDSSFDLAQL